MADCNDNLNDTCTNYEEEYYEPQPDGECCELIPIILEKVDWLMDEWAAFKGIDTWRYEWFYELEPLFTKDTIYKKEGPGTGFPGLMQLVKELYEFNLDIHKDLAAKENYVAMPEHWQLPPEAQRPQLVVQSAELDEEGNFDSAKYVTTIPYYNKSEGFSVPPFNHLSKGSTQGMLVLKDNSKVIIYAQNQNEANRVLNLIKSSINPTQLEDSYIKLGRIKNPYMKEVVVYPKYARFYPAGVKEEFSWQVAYPLP